MAGDTEQLDRVETALDDIQRLLEGEQLDEALALLADLHPADQAEVISELDGAERALILPRLTQDGLAEILVYLREEPRMIVVAELDDRLLGRLLDQVDRDVAVDVLHALEGERAREVLVGMSRALELAPLLQHEDESAGGRMTSDFVALPRGWTVEQTIAHLRQWRPKADQAYYLYVVDPQQRLEGVVSLRNLVVATPEERISDLMAADIVSVRVGEDQEEVARRIQRYNFIALPVVDEQRRLVGVVNIDDLMDVVQEEATEDMYRMATLPEDETLLRPVVQSITPRLGWLLVNLITAFAAAATVNAFEGTIERVAALAVFMPIIAGMGGNAGIQTITLVVRSIALGEVELGDVRRVLVR
ncbi:MAG: magnesium transporter, partial [Dehalococcoidia bacterium]